MTTFNIHDFKRVGLEDKALLLPRLTASKEQSCEFNYSNLFVWGFSYGTKYQIYNGHLYLFLETEDQLMFAERPVPGDAPDAEELHAVSDAMREAGFSGDFVQIRPDYWNADPKLAEYFDAVPEKDEFAEYMYEVEALFELKGSKLAKKRNLISQFERDYPEARICPISTPEILADCIALAERWRLAQEDPETLALQHEADALRHVGEHFFELDMDGVAVYVLDRLMAFSMVSRISGDTFTEPFEKADHEAKGAAQFINHETARLLLGRCRILNREQDLGMPGLRHAKQSYMPAFLLRNYRLVRR